MGGEMPDADGKARSAGAAASGFPPPVSAPHHHHQYGTFGPPSASGEFPQPAVGFPQPAPPPGLRHYPPAAAASYAVYPPQQPYSASAPYYAQGYQAVQGYIPIVGGRPVRMRRLPCCGLGMGWFLFIIGFFLAAIPWYIGAFVLICVRVHDYRRNQNMLPVLFLSRLDSNSVIGWKHLYGCSTNSYTKFIGRSAAARPKRCRCPFFPRPRCV